MQRKKVLLKTRQTDYRNKWLSKWLTREQKKVVIRTVDYFKVIDAAEIQDLEEPPFNQSPYLSEEEYKMYLEKAQILFDEYSNTGSIHTIEYKSLEDIEKNREEERFLCNFRYSFLHYGKCICVRKTMDGTYKVTSNGRHRAFVAKKYELRLLVHVIEEEAVC